MVELDDQRIKSISEYMFIPDKPLKADVTIILGQTLWQRPLQKGVELYEAGISGRLIFTGGFNPKLGCREALQMKIAWLEMGYPLDDILIDSEATNTMENMQNARSLMSRSGLLRSPTIVNLVSINYHMRRAAETLKHVFASDSLQLGIVNYPSKHCSPNFWHDNPKGRSLVINEIFKIKKYLNHAI